MAKVQMNIGFVEKKAIAAFKDSAFLLGREYTRLISDNNAFPEFPGQDIVDLGALRASQRVSFPGPGVAIFSWDVEYALYVHEGYTLRNGREQPGRPWGTEGLKNFDFEGTFQKLLSLKLKT